MNKHEHHPAIQQLHRDAFDRRIKCLRLKICLEELAVAESGAYKNEAPQFFDLYERAA